MGLKLFQLSGALPGLGTEITVAGGHIVGIVWRVEQECSIFKAKYSRFRLIGPPVYRVSRLIGPNC